MTIQLLDEIYMPDPTAEEEAEKQQKQSSPASKFLMSVLAVCVFQGISTFRVNCLVA